MRKCKFSVDLQYTTKHKYSCFFKKQLINHLVHLLSFFCAQVLLISPLALWIILSDARDNEIIIRVPQSISIFRLADISVCYFNILKFILTEETHQERTPKEAVLLPPLLFLSGNWVAGLFRLLGHKMVLVCNKTRSNHFVVDKCANLIYVTET